MKLQPALFLALAPVLLALPASASGQDANQLAIKARDILKKHCADCHGDVERPKAKLNVIDHAKLLKSEMIVPKKPNESILIERVSLSADDQFRMPPKGKDLLTAQEIDVLRGWIAAGAPAADDKAAVTTAVALAAKEFSVAARVKDIFRNRCFTCHNSPSSRGRLDIFNAALMRQRNLVDKNNPDSSPLLLKVRSGDPNEVMPPTGPRLDEKEIDLIRTWILEGAPDFEADLVVDPKHLGREYIYDQILRDTRELRSEAKNYRYFSFNHLLIAGVTREDLKAHEHALALAVNHLSWQPALQKPVAIDPANSIFRVNVEALGWLEAPYKDIDNDRAADTTLYDLVLLEYPYGVIADASENYALLAREFLSTLKQARPVAYLRGDWFVSVALQSPLYEDLLQLPRDLNTLEQLLGVDSERNIARNQARRAGMTVSGVSRNNRIVERHQAGTTYYWKSLDFATSAGQSNILANPTTRTADGGEMIWSLPNGLQAYYVADAKGKRINFAPTTIVVDGNASDQTVRNALSCIRCHTAGIQPFEDVVRPAIDSLDGNPPGVNRQEVRNLYEVKKVMDGLIAQDKSRFNAAVAELLGEPVNVTNAFKRVTDRYIDRAINGYTAIAELGKKEPGNWKAAFAVGANALLGMSHLATDGHIRRDAWEASHDRVIENLNMGIPVVPLNALSVRNFEPKEPHLVDIKLNRVKLDQAELLISNTGRTDLFIEVVLLANNGKIVRLSDGVVDLKAKGDAFRFPAETDKFLPIKPDDLVDNVVVYSGTKKFEPGVVLRLNDTFRQGLAMADRFVHASYRVTSDGEIIEVANDPREIQKKTAELVTR